MSGRLRAPVRSGIRRGHSATARTAASGRQCRQSRGEESLSRASQPIDTRKYWATNLRLTVALLCVWFVVSYGAGILFRDFLDRFSIGGAPLGFWFAQQGSIYVFVVLIFCYCFAMRRLERRHRIGLEP